MSGREKDEGERKPLKKKKGWGNKIHNNISRKKYFSRSCMNKQTAAYIFGLEKYQEEQYEQQWFLYKQQFN